MSQLVYLGLSYKTAPVEIREQAALAAAAQSQLLQLAATGQLSGVDEFAILSTCNRTELYAVGESESATQTLLRLWQEHSILSEQDVHAYTVYLSGESCVQHLFNVAAGLESQVVGEPQILGQVIEAYEQARSHNATGAVLSTLFQQAIQTGKRVRHETDLGHGALSISSVAATHSSTILGSLEQAHVLIIGAGEMARAAAASFVRRGIDHLSIANHTLDHAQELADQWGGQVVPFTQLGAALVAADLVITAAASPHALLNISDLEVILPQRSARPLIIFDIALPRNVAPEVGTLPGVQLYNLDDLQAVTDAHYSVRQTAIPHAEAIVAEEIQTFARWQASRAAVPVIQNLRAKADSIRQAELDHLINRWPELDEHQRQLLDEFSHRLINKLLHHPTLRLKAQTAEGQGELYASVVDDLFDLMVTQP